ncbi:MAG: hypothetical protein IGS48_01150 [Oscillatoriales cyanobacterium C42_A2020_001]|nr:hypothetical protein [Leptolyngbyaceae cyanobacterium C42_A2020_001]
MESLTHEEFVHSILGNEAEFLTITIADETWHEWARPAQEDDWKRVPPLCHSFYQRNIRLFSTFCFELDCYALLAIPNLPVFDIPKYAFTGVGIFGDDEAPAQIQKVLAEVYSQCPFEITWIDPVALSGFFMRKITDSQAQIIEESIEDVFPGSNGHFFNEWLQAYEERVGDPTVGARLFQANVQRYIERKISELPEDLPEVPALWKLIQERQEFRISLDPW